MRPGRTRLRRGLAGTAAAVAAMTALTASQAPGLVPSLPVADGNSAADTGTWPVTPNDDSYHVELPPLPVAVPPAREPGSGPAVPVDAVRAESGIPATVLAAYRGAEARIGRSDPGCRLPWQLLAAIGKVESGQASGGRVDAAGTTLTPILGPVLDGNGFAHIADTDNGAWDGDIRYDRAVGPMQFIPSTWANWGQDANGDGRRDPNNIHDAALAAGRYLCAGGRSLAVKAHLDRAILSYNHSQEYLRTVLAWLDFYRKGVHPVADGRGVIPASPGPGGDTPAERPVGDGGQGGEEAAARSSSGRRGAHRRRAPRRPAIPLPGRGRACPVRGRHPIRPRTLRPIRPPIPRRTRAPTPRPTRPPIPVPPSRTAPRRPLRRPSRPASHPLRPVRATDRLPATTRAHPPDGGSTWARS